MSAFPVRPYVIELRRGLYRWEWRSDFSFHDWKETWLPPTESLDRVRDDLKELRPDYLIVCPEVEDKASWEDC